MKLNYKRTMLVGFAFFFIMAFWQAYETIIPVILTDKFGMKQSISGVIMALDNILALFMLPFFGALSDKCTHKKGKRTPFIVVGTVIACVAIVALAAVDHVQTGKLDAIDPANYGKESLEMLYDQAENIKVHPTEEDAVNMGLDEKEKYPLSDIVSKADFSAIAMTGEDGKATSEYTNYVLPTREAYASKITSASPATLIIFIAVLLILLVSMGIFRSPAVALMPDVTPKPLRSKGNAIINLMGTFGGMLVLLFGILLGVGKPENIIMDYALYFGIVAGIMIVGLAVYLFTVKEPQWAKEAEEINRRIDAESEETPEETAAETRKLTRSEKISLILILASVALWYMGYNAVTSKYSVYSTKVLKMNYSLPLLIAQGAAVVSFIPVGIISSKFGRKKAVLTGVAMLTAALAMACFADETTPMAVVIGFFVLAGIGWATINVNSFPMVVELATGSNTGKYTGYYYTASMAAQTVTPVLSGFLLDINMRTLFPYAAVFTTLSFITMLFVKHGDSKPAVTGSVLERMGEAMDD